MARRSSGRGAGTGTWSTRGPVHSIRRRLLLVLSIGFVAIVLGALLYVEGITRSLVTEEFDAVLLAQARGLVSLIAIEKGVVEFEYAPDAMPQFERKERPDYFQIWLDNGTVLPEGRSGSLAKGVDLARTGSLSLEPSFRDIALPDGRPGRSVQLAFVPGPDRADQKDEEPIVASSAGGHAFVLVVARGRERLDALLASTRLAILLAGAAAALLASILVWRAVVSGLRPLQAIATQVKALDAESLDARIPAPGAPAELAPIVEQLNALLARLEASFQRERRFAGHVSHELRTPIAELRSLAEVGGKWPEDLASTRRFFADVHEIAGRMERVVNDLLLLARCHAGVERVELQPVRLAEAAHACLASLGADGRVETLIPGAIVLDADPGKLSLVLTNLLDNALTYATPGGPVRCEAETGGGRFRLEISNPSEALTEDDLAHLPEPFWRKDRARSPDGHSGLGLSLVTALAPLLHLEVAFRHEGGRFRARLTGRLRDGETKPIQSFAAYPQVRTGAPCKEER
jgi:signal transduction histidine kinase